jgi:hypothetical protein
MAHRHPVSFDHDDRVSSPPSAKCISGWADVGGKLPTERHHAQAHEDDLLPRWFNACPTQRTNTAADSSVSREERYRDVRIGDGGHRPCALICWHPLRKT